MPRKPTQKGGTSYDPNRPSGRIARREYSAKLAEKREEKTATQVAAAIAASISPGMDATLKEIAQESGVPPSVVSKLFQMLRTKGLALGRALGEVTRDETRKLYDYQAQRILASITDEDIAEASLYQKMTSAAIATDKGLLLDGQPTQIFSVKQLENLDTLVGGLLGEMERRGLATHTIEVPETGAEPALVPIQRTVVTDPRTAEGTQKPQRWKDPARGRKPRTPAAAPPGQLP